MSETGPQWRGGTVRASMDGHPPAEREGTATVARAVEGLPTGHRHVWGWLRNSCPPTELVASTRSVATAQGAGVPAAAWARRYVPPATEVTSWRWGDDEPGRFNIQHSDPAHNNTLRPQDPAARHGRAASTRAQDPRDQPLHQPREPAARHQASHCLLVYVSPARPRWRRTKIM